MFTPKEFAFPDADLAAKIGLPENPDGWGLLYCVNELDLRYTLAGNEQYVRLMFDFPPTGSPATLDVSKIGQIELSGFRVKRGWPDTWSKKDQRAEWEVHTES